MGIYILFSRILILALLSSCTAPPDSALNNENMETANLALDDFAIQGVQSKRCVDIAGVSQEDGAQAQLWDCHNGTNQTWTYSTNKELLVYGNKCLQALDGGTSNLTPVVIGSCSGQPHQQWNINSDQTITNVKSGLCMDAEGAGTDNGVRIVLWSCWMGDNQKWDVDSGKTTYTLSIFASGNGSTTPAPGSYIYDAGEMATITAIPSNGEVFTGWSGAVSGTTNPITVTMDDNKSLIANFSGSSPTPEGPCDIYANAGTPCVAAHSTVRALYGSYTGSLYQVRRASDGATRDIPVLNAGGYANAAVQDRFCNNISCTISIIYDQSPHGNHLTKAPPGGWLNNGGLEADAKAARITLNGHPVYGVYTTMSWDNDIGGVGYRNNNTTGIATGDEAEAIYMVVSGRHYNQWCCFDYGNAETNNLDNGDATMEAVYFGSSTQWAVGNGDGPWVLADLENGVFHGHDPHTVTETNTPIIADYVTAMLKGPSGNRFALKAGNAQSGSLITKYDGPRPDGYSPMKKEGAIILGVGGDNSHTGVGTFFEGCMTSGNPSAHIDDAIQANIVAAGYGS